MATMTEDDPLRRLRPRNPLLTQSVALDEPRATTSQVHAALAADSRLSEWSCAPTPSKSDRRHQRLESECQRYLSRQAWRPEAEVGDSVTIGAQRIAARSGMRPIPCRGRRPLETYRLSRYLSGWEKSPLTSPRLVRASPGMAQSAAGLAQTESQDRQDCQDRG